MQKLTNQKGITLIALVITIIVMLILVGVSVTVALNGGLFSTAQKATGDTKAERDNELALSHGKVTINGEEYNSIDEYVNGTESENETEGETNSRTGALGEAVNTENYGKKVVGFTSKGEGLESIIWRVFYQDANNVYLISDIVDEDGESSSPVTGFGLDSVVDLYSSGADVSIQGQDLMPLANELFTENNTNDNIKATAYLCDIEVWDKYTDAEGQAAWAMGGPTIELFVKSFNAIQSENVIELSIEEHGYDENSDYTTFGVDTALNPFFNDTFLASSARSYWIASPGYSDTTVCCMDCADLLSVGYDIQCGMGLHPVVCIPASNFNYTLE